MRSLRSLSLVLLLAVVPLLCFANTNKKTINIVDRVKVGSTVLQPGEYVVQWDGNGPSVQVQFRQNNKVVATAPASVQNQSSPYDGAVDMKSVQGSDTKALHAIDLKDRALVFDQGTNTASR